MSQGATSFWLQSFHRHGVHRPFNAKTVCVTGGKGGVGKTSIALRLSLELARWGRKVLLIDCDYNSSNTAIKLGLPLNDKFFKLLCGEISLADALYKKGRFHLLGACNGNIELFEQDQRCITFFLESMVDQKNNYDYIILDSPSGITRQTIFFASYCDERIFVVNPDFSSIADAYSLVKIINNKFSIKENILLVNKVQRREQFERTVKTFSETAENYLSVRSHILGAISLVNIEHESFDQQFLAMKNNPQGENFIKIVQKFLEKVEGPRRSGSMGFRAQLNAMA